MKPLQYDPTKLARINLLVPIKTRKKAEKLAERKNKNITDIIREALDLYSYLQSEIDKGKTIVLSDKDKDKDKDTDTEIIVTSFL